jgi:type IV secretion system protein TrbL
MVIRSRCTILVVAVASLVLVFAGRGHAADMSGVVDTLLGKYQTAGQAWVGALRGGATTLFWILATISLAWTCIAMAIKRAEMGELFAEICRFILVTGFFFWLLLNGPDFATDIINSLRTVGGDAAGTGKAIYPAQLINLGLQVFVNQMNHINFLLPAVTGIPALIALIVLVVCALIAVNMILLLCAAWIVLYAGLIFLGFGGSKWTSDMAINYYRTVLGVGVSLMTMQLIIGIGIKFLQDLVTTTGDNPDVGQLALVMVACIILAVIAHRLPQMVAGMVVGGGTNGAVGGIGIMSVLGAAIAASSLARTAAAASGAGAAVEAGNASYKLLMDRIQAAETAISAGSGNGGSGISPNAGAGGGSTTTGQAGSGLGGGLTGGGGTGRGPTGPASSNRLASGTSTSQVTASTASPGGTNPSTGSGPTIASGAEEREEPPLIRPMTPDEQRGFPPPIDPPEWETKV